MDNQVSEMNRILVRVEVLERRQRAMKRMAGVCVVTVAAVLLMGQMPTGGRALEAEKLTIVDAQHRTRLVLGTMEDGPYLVLYDTKERARMALSISGEGSNIEYYDTSGKRRVALAETGSGAGLEFYDPAEKRRVGLLSAGEAPSLVFSDGSSMTRLILGVGTEGPDLEMYGVNGKRRVALGGLEEVGPRFALFDADGLARTAMGVTRQGPTLILSDDRVRPSFELEVVETGPRIQFKHSGGKTGIALDLAGGKPSLKMTDSNGTALFNAP